MKKVRTRIAPSPTGNPHIGTMFQGLLDYVFAKKHGGDFIVRIEDTDQKRKMENAEEELFKAFAWIGIEPDESPVHGGKFGPYRQSERLKIYNKHAKDLIESGKAYYCFCSPARLERVRADMQKAGQPPMYDRHCRDIDPVEAKRRSESENCVVRMIVPDGETIVLKDLIRGEIKFESRVVDDQVLLKSDGFPTYHLAVVVDDHLMEISHVVRGEEWISSAPKHILLYRYFGWDMPALVHTPLLRNPDKSKLSKRHGHAQVDWYVKEGYLKEAVVNFLATRVWNHPKGEEVFGMEELIEHFDLADMHITGPIVDLDKLKWLNGQWIRRMGDNELLERMEPFVPSGLARDKLEKIWPLVKERIEKLSDIEELTDYLVEMPELDVKAVLRESKVNAVKTAEYLGQVIEALETVDSWSVSQLEKRLHQLQEETGWKPRPAFMTIRLAATGRSATPPLFDTLEVIGKTETIKRLAHAKEKLE